MKVDIRKLGHSEKAPMDLLLRADPSIEMIEKYIYSGDCYLAESDGETAGTFVLLPNSAHEIELKNISLAPKFQGLGIGKEIIKYVIRISKMEGYESIIVKTADTSTEVIKFYKKLKFEEYFTAFNEVSKAYKLLTENQYRHPSFVANKKSLGILHAIIGTIPDVADDQFLRKRPSLA